MRQEKAGLFSGDLAGGGEVCVGKGLNLEEMSGCAGRLERARRQAGRAV